MGEVWNRRDPYVPLNAVYVGRPTKWGNPFTHLTGKTAAQYTVASRHDAIVEYRRWLQDQPELLASLPELRGRDLVCWCAPAECHANVLLELANMDDAEFLIRQTFSVTEDSYDTEPTVTLPDPLEPRPTPGFYRRASNKPPKGTVPLFEFDEEPARTEYDH